MITGHNNTATSQAPNAHSFSAQMVFLTCPLSSLATIALALTLVPVALLQSDTDTAPSALVYLTGASVAGQKMSEWVSE